MEGVEGEWVGRTEDNTYHKHMVYSYIVFVGLMLQIHYDCVSCHCNLNSRGCNKHHHLTFGTPTHMNTELYNLPF